MTVVTLTQVRKNLRKFLKDGTNGEISRKNKYKDKLVNTISLDPVTRSIAW